MNFLHHRQKTPNHVLPIPEGLQELMADISREVLRCQPSLDCTYKFIADYLEAMLRTREKSKIAMEIIEDAIRKTDEVYEQFIKCNIPKDKTTKFLDMMEITFRRFVEQKRRLNEDPRYITFQTDDMLEELIRKCDLTKVEILQSRPAIQWAYRKFVETYLAAVEGTLDTEDLYLDTEKLIASQKEMQNLNEAAVKIQKVYRGHTTRRCLKGSLDLKSTEEFRSGSIMVFKEELDMEKQEDIIQAAEKIQEEVKGYQVGKEKFAIEDEEECNKAAITIQSRYKGYTTRKRLQAGETSMGVPVETLGKSYSTKMDLDIVKPEQEAEVNKLTILDLATPENMEEMDRAASRIQANFKGYRVRKKLRSSNHEQSSGEAHSESRQTSLGSHQSATLDEIGIY